MPSKIIPNIISTEKEEEVNEFLEAATNRFDDADPNAQGSAVSDFWVAWGTFVQRTSQFNPNGIESRNIEDFHEHFKSQMEKNKPFAAKFSTQRANSHAISVSIYEFKPSNDSGFGGIDTEPILQRNAVTGSLETQNAVLNERIKQCQKDLAEQKKQYEERIKRAKELIDDLEKQIEEKTNKVRRLIREKKEQEQALGAVEKKGFLQGLLESEEGKQIVSAGVGIIAGLLGNKIAPPKQPAEYDEDSSEQDFTPSDKQNQSTTSQKQNFNENQSFEANEYE